jgi:prophage regulatory protein
MRQLQDRILRLPQVIALTSLSPATIDRQEKIGHFPRRRRIGLRAVGWLESEIQAWLSNRVQKPTSKKISAYGALRDVEGYIPSTPGANL